MKQLIWAVSLVMLTASPSSAIDKPAQISKTKAINLESPNKISKIQGMIKPSGEGPSRLVLHSGVSGKKIELTNKPLFFEPKVEWHGEDFVEVQLWTTPNKSESIFYDLIKSKKSVPIANVIATDGRKLIVANVDDNRLRLVDVFKMTKPGFYYGDNSIALDGNFPDDKPLLDVVTRAEFTPDGDFILRYRVRDKVDMGVRVSGEQIRF